MAVLPSQQWPRGPVNELHHAACFGSTERTVNVLAKGVIDIDEGEPDGFSPLMLAAGGGHSRVVRILLNKGASMSVVNDDGLSALHVAAQEGHPAVIKVLVKAGADLAAKTVDRGCTPLHMAAEQGRSEVVRVLIGAGANPNSRELDGSTPLYCAAQQGHVNAIKVLLRAKANPLLTNSSPGTRADLIPLDIAAYNGHLEVAHELIRQLGIEGCGGATGGVYALQGAAQTQQMEVMELLTSAGVVDTGVALQDAANSGRESSVKFLLQHWKRNTSGQGADYLETCNPDGRTTIVRCIQACRSCSPRIARMLVDAGVDTSTAVALIINGEEIVLDSPLALVDCHLSAKMVGGADATESQLHRLEAIRRLLMRVEAVHAASWLWAKTDAPSVPQAATEAISTPVMWMLPILRRRAGRPRLLLAAMFRHSKKP